MGSAEEAGPSKAGAAAGWSGSRPGPVREGGREDAARRNPAPALAVLSLTRVKDVVASCRRDFSVEHTSVNLP
ncbi:unnamed protein product [Caretta caretta]